MICDYGIKEGGVIIKRARFCAISGKFLPDGGTNHEGDEVINIPSTNLYIIVDPELNPSPSELNKLKAQIIKQYHGDEINPPSPVTIADVTPPQ